LADIANLLRKIIEKKEEREDPSGGFLPYRVRLKTASLIDESGSLLDIGCGEGLFLVKVQNLRHKHLYGIDPWEEVLKKAKERVTASFFRGDGYRLPFKDESFDEITILNLFYNLPDLSKMLSLMSEALRVCRKGGKIIFDYRNRRNPLIWLGYRTVKVHDPDIKIPVNAYTRSEIRSFLRSSGIERATYYPIPGWWKVNPPTYVVEIIKS
jgi:ubiquinone/menaquinone biosynthesis C-methylase UbiE